MNIPEGHTVVMFTGHRRIKGKYDSKSFEWNWVENRIRDILEVLTHLHGPLAVLSGVAVGVDQKVAWVCSKMDIPFIACIPFQGFESAWPLHVQNHYRWLVQRAFHTEVISQDNSLDAYQRRNEFMVDNAQVHVAIWNGSKGGTGNTVDYIKARGHSFWRINPDTFEVVYVSGGATEEAVTA